MRLDRRRARSIPPTLTKNLPRRRRWIQWFPTLIFRRRSSSSCEHKLPVSLVYLFRLLDADRHFFAVRGSLGATTCSVKVLVVSEIPIAYCHATMRCMLHSKPDCLPKSCAILLSGSSDPTNQPHQTCPRLRKSPPRFDC